MPQIAPPLLPQGINQANRRCRVVEQHGFRQLMESYGRGRQACATFHAARTGLQGEGGETANEEHSSGRRSPPSRKGCKAARPGAACPHGWEGGLGWGEGVDQLATTGWRAGQGYKWEALGEQMRVRTTDVQGLGTKGRREGVCNAVRSPIEIAPAPHARHTHPIPPRSNPHQSLPSQSGASKVLEGSHV